MKRLMKTVANRVEVPYIVSISYMEKIESPDGRELYEKKIKFEERKRYETRNERVPMEEQEQDEVLQFWSENSGKTKEELLDEHGEEINPST